MLKKIINTLALKFKFLTLKDVNRPLYSNKGEIGGYIIYDKTKGAKITNSFVKNLLNLGINILYFNTPRDKKNPETFLSYEEWLEIFEKFKGSNVKLMLYIYEALDKKDSSGNIIYKKWTNSQIQSISNHPAFYGWIAEDEVRFGSYDLSHSWIKTFHSLKWGDGTKKWPNMSICFLPNVPRLNVNCIGNTYLDYLEKWSNAADIVLSDLYPYVCSDDIKYNLKSNGKFVDNKTDGGKYWYNYLQSHCSFILSHPELTHRFYIHSCKHIANDGKLYVARPKPTLTSLLIQAYASLMAGSNGFMFFVLGDIPSEDGTGFYEAAFNEKCSVNTSTYNLIKSFLNSLKFKNFKNLIVGLKILYLLWKDLSILKGFFKTIGDDNTLVSIATNDDYIYCTVLNTSFTEPIKVELLSGVQIIDLENLNVPTKAKKGDIYKINPGNILCLKIKKE